MTEFRATDAERERTVKVLHAAAAEGCLTPEELDDRLDRAYGAVWQRDLPPLTADLPPLRTLDPALQPGSALAADRESRFWVWAFLPWVGAGAWVHAAFVTRTRRYALLAVPYSVPLVLMAFTDTGGAEEADISGWVLVIVVAFWVINAIHAWTARPEVARLMARLDQGA